MGIRACEKASSCRLRQLSQNAMHENSNEATPNKKVSCPDDLRQFHSQRAIDTALVKESPLRIFPVSSPCVFSTQPCTLILEAGRLLYSSFVPGRRIHRMGVQLEFSCCLSE